MGLYDNGCCMLGKVCDIKKYFLKNCEDLSDYEELLKDFEELLQDLENEEEDTIVAVNYDFPMGYHIEFFDNSSKVEV